MKPDNLPIVKVEVHGHQHFSIGHLVAVGVTAAGPQALVWEGDMLMVRPLDGQAGGAFYQIKRAPAEEPTKRAKPRKWFTTEKTAWRW